MSLPTKVNKNSQEYPPPIQILVGNKTVLPGKITLEKAPQQEIRTASGRTHYVKNRGGVKVKIEFWWMGNEEILIPSIGDRKKLKKHHRLTRKMKI